MSFIHRSAKKFLPVVGSFLLSVVGASAGMFEVEWDKLAPEKHVANELLILLEPGVDIQKLAGANDKLGADMVKRTKRLNLVKVTVPGGQDLGEAAADYEKIAGVISVEPNYYHYRTETFPDDPDYSIQWGFPYIEAPLGWDVSVGSTQVVVGIVDSGIDLDHPDLASNIWHNLGEDINGDGMVTEADRDGVDTDNNGYIDDFHGWDFVHLNEDGRQVPNIPEDQNLHGTHVAGTVGAIGNNMIGVSGVNWMVKLASLKIFGSDAEAPATSENIARAIEYCVVNGFPVSNNSWGGGPPGQAIRSAIELGLTENHLFVAAAGNANNNNDVQPFYPCSYTLDNIISVAAVDRQGDRASFSNYGITSVDIAAPGVDIHSTFPFPPTPDSGGTDTDGDGYASISGTSMASPHVAGVAAWLLSLNPAATWDQVKEAILIGSRVNPKLDGLVAGSRELNMPLALAAFPGALRFDQACYSSNSVMTISVTDALAVGASVTVTLSWGFGNTLDVDLPRVGDIDFEAMVPVSALVPPVGEEEIVTGTYVSPLATTTVEVRIDNTPPMVSDFEITVASDETAFFQFMVNEEVSVNAYVGETLPLQVNTNLTTSIDPVILDSGLTNYLVQVRVRNLEPRTKYFLGIEAVDCAGNLLSIPADLASLNEANYPFFVTRVRRTLLTSRFDSGPESWQAEVLIGSKPIWQHGVPVFGPDGASSPPNAWGTVLDGRYPNGANGVVKSPVVQVKDFPRIEFKAWHEISEFHPFDTNLLFAPPDRDAAYIEVSRGSGWENVTVLADRYSNPSITQSAPFWQDVRLDLVGAMSNTAMEVRFRLETDEIAGAPGMFFDDVVISDVPAVGINIFDFVIDDTVGGDGDGYPEPGETFTLRLTAFNSDFKRGFTNVRLKLDTVEQDIDLRQTTSPQPIGNLGPSDIASTTVNAVITLGSNIADETVATFFMTAQTGENETFSEAFNLIIGKRETATGTVTEINTPLTPIADATVVGKADGHPTIEALTMADGTYALHGFVPGVTYAVEALKPNAFSRSVPAVDVVGPAAGIDFVLGEAYANIPIANLIIPVLQGQGVSTNITLDNLLGTVPLEYETSIEYVSVGGSDWLTMDPASGSVSNGTTAALTFTADAGIFTPRTLNALVTFSGNEISGEDIIILVQMIVLPGPDLSISRVLIENGDQDRFAEPGETVDIRVQLLNQGELAAPLPIGSLRVVSPATGVTIDDADSSWLTVPPFFLRDPAFDDLFTITLTNTIAEGTSLDFELDVADTNGNMWTLPFTVTSVVRHAISGRILETPSGNPVDDALVRVTGPLVNSDLSDAGGNYSVTGLIPGDYVVTVDPPLPFSRPVSQNVTIDDQDVSGINFLLGTWDMVVNPTSIVTTVAEGEETVVQLDVTNQGGLDGSVDLIVQSRLDIPNAVAEELQNTVVDWDNLKPWVDYMPGELLVTYKNRVPAQRRVQALAGFGAKVMRTYRTLPTSHIKVANNIPLKVIAEALQAREDVLLVEPNYLRFPSRLPDDNNLALLWGMRNVRQTGGTKGADINVEGIWDLTTGTRDIIVAINDTGVDVDHPDLAANIYRNPDEELGDANFDGAPGLLGFDDDGDAAETAEINTINGIDDDGDGAVDETGIDFLDQDVMLADYNNNGTPLAGFDGIFGNFDDDTNDYPFAQADDDENGLHDDINGYDFGDNDPDPRPGSAEGEDHGTHVAGTVGAVGDNASGVVGVNWHVTLLPIKITQTVRDPITDTLIAVITADGVMRGVEYAAERGARVSNHSYGGGAFSATERMIIQRATAQDQLFVAAAGNDGDDNDVNGAYPASYNLDRIISVAAADDNDIRATFSNYGRESVDLAAPGVGIYSTITAFGIQGWGYKSGTSMASPHVAGAAALLLSLHPKATPNMLKEAMMEGVRPDRRLSRHCVASGHLDVMGALDVLRPFWIDQNPDRLTLPSGATETVDLTFNAGTPLVAGTYYADLFVTEDRNSIRVPLELTVTPAPAPRFRSVAVLDSVTGDGDFLAEPGEVVDLQISLLVSGSAFFINSTGLLSSADANVTFVDGDNEGAWPSGLSGATITSTDNFRVAFSPAASGEIEFDLMVGNDSFGPYPLSFTVNVAPSRSISGRLVDGSTGAGLANKRVEYWGVSAGSVMTDANGNYRLDGLADGMHRIRGLADTHEKSEVMSVNIAGADVHGMDIEVVATAPTFSTREVVINVPRGGSTNESFSIENLVDEAFDYEIVELPVKKITLISDAAQLNVVAPSLRRMGFDVAVFSNNLYTAFDEDLFDTFPSGRFSEDLPVLLQSSLVIMDLTGDTGFGRVLSQPEIDAFTEYLARGGRLMFTGANPITRPDNEQLNGLVDGASLDRADIVTTVASAQGGISVNRFVDVQPGENVAVVPQQYDLVSSAAEVLFKSNLADKITRKQSPVSGGTTFVWSGNPDAADWQEEGVWLDFLKNMLISELQTDVTWLDASPVDTDVTAESVSIDVQAEAAGLTIGTYEARLLVNGNYPGTDVDFVKVTLNVLPLNLIAKADGGVVDWLGRPLDGNGNADADFFQLINAGVNGVIDPPSQSGAPGGDDRIIETFIGGADLGRFGVGRPLAPNTGTFELEFNHGIDRTIMPRNVYVRAWDGPAVSSSVAYGDSELYMLQVSIDEMHDFGSWVVGTVPNYPGPNAADINGDTVPDGYYVSVGLDPRDPVGPAEPDLTASCNIGQFGNDHGEFNTPTRLFVTDAFIFVLDSGNNRVQVFDRATGVNIPNKTFGMIGTGPGQFSLPYGMARFPDEDKFVVLDTGNDRVQVLSFDPADGTITFLSEFGTTGNAPGQFVDPRGIAVDPVGNIYVADTFNNRIQILLEDGTVLTTFGVPGSAQGSFAKPEGIDVDVNGVVFVADSENHRVQVLNGAGIPLYQFGSEGNGNGQFLRPSGIKIGTGGFIYVADTSNSRIQVFDKDRNFVAVLGTLGNFPEQLRFPQDLFPIIGSNELYVADTRNHRVQCFNTTFDGDGDGMDDVWEFLNGLDFQDPSDNLADADGDGTSNIGEYRIGTDPQEADTDGDGVPEAIELIVGTDPLDDTSTVIYIQSQEIALDGSLKLNFSVTAGETYTLQENDDLTNLAGWSDLIISGSPFTAISTGTDSITVPNGVFDPIKHYRVVTTPAP